MAKPAGLDNDVRDRRAGLGWSQQDLAGRSGLSRAGVGAIESGRSVPSTAAALALAGALGCRVEDLFRLPRPAPAPPAWAWPPRGPSGRYWHAEVGGLVRLYPAEATSLGAIPHDGTTRDGAPDGPARSDPARTLVLASCDPAAGLLADELARSSGFRLIVLGRSSRSALALMGAGLAHAAGVHLAGLGEPDGNAAAVREAAGPGHALLRVAAWEEGIASAPGRGVATAREALGPRIRWVGREPGSGARLCLDAVLDGRRPPRRSAADHRGVAEAIRRGWADVGVCHRLAAEDAGLNFLAVREAAYDIAFPRSLEADPRIRALVAAVRSPSYRRTLAELPGYVVAGAGELRRLD